MKHRNPSMRRLPALTLVAAAVLAAPLVLAKGGPPGGGGNPGETAGNNISFPLILSDNVGPALPADASWSFAPITDPQNQCIGEEGTSTGVVDPSIVCYYGRKVTVVSETGEIVFTGPPKVWWLQKRSANFWKALVIGRSTATPLVVSAIDVGDLLESTPSIGTRQIRTEFNLLQHVDPLDPELGSYVVNPDLWTSPGIPYPCQIPAAGSTSPSLGCFAALAMSGAVPGTEQSGNEMQGTDFGPPAFTWGTQELLDPAEVRETDPYIGGVEAIVYSRCARLLAQRLLGAPTWNPALGQWNNAAAPVVNIAAYSDAYNAEINSGGSIVYGYNWNAKTVPTGTYRLTFVLDGNDGQGPACTTTLATRFERGVTQLVNVGEANPAQIVYAGEGGLVDEGGLVYVDVALSTKGGGGGGGKGPK